MKFENRWIVLASAAIVVAIQSCEMAHPTAIDDPLTRSVSLAPTATAGKIVVNHDEWTLSNTGFAQAADASQFALNIASWFTDGSLGNLLVYSSNFGLVGSDLSAVMTGAGHTWSIVDPSNPLPSLTPFDAVFVAGNNVDNEALIEYVNTGGNVYLGGGTANIGSAQDEADAWNTFLNTFGLHYMAPYNGVRGVLPITSTHPILTSVAALYQDNGNSVSELDPADPNTDILEFAGEHGLYGVFAIEVPPNTPPIANAGVDQIVECLGPATSVTLDGSGSTDPDGDELTYTWTDSAGNVVATGVNPTITLGLGVHTLMLIVSDGEFEHTDDVEITIVDTVGPNIDLVLHERRLWSRHHKMRLVATVSATDECDPFPTLIVTVTNHKRKHEPSHRESRPDWEVVDNGDGTFDVFIRVGRNRHGGQWHWSPGNTDVSMSSSSWGHDSYRITYTITAIAVDESGNESTVMSEVSFYQPRDDKDRDHGKKR